MTWMNNDILIFENEEFGDIRTFEANNEPWFLAADICKALGLLDPRYRNIDDPMARPHTEALCDTIARIVPYWENVIRPRVAKSEGDIIIAAHGNSLRGIIKVLKNISNDDIINLNLPTGIPYVFEFDDNMNLQKDYFLADEETVKKLMDAVANQGNKK